MRRVLQAIAFLLFIAPLAFAALGGGEITFHVSGAADVLFSHEFHVHKKGLKCSDCHNAIFKPKASVFSTTMKRMQEGEACGACHNGQRAFDVRANCARCHKG